MTPELQLVKSPQQGGTTVIANPDLAGTEEALTGLQVGATKYKVESGKDDIVLNTQAAALETVTITDEEDITKLDAVLARLEVDGTDMPNRVIVSVSDVMMAFNISDAYSELGEGGITAGAVSYGQQGLTLVAQPVALIIGNTEGSWKIQELEGATE